MTKKKKPTEKLLAWMEARKRHRLSDTQVQMARELGMYPSTLGKLDNHDQGPGKMALGQYIEHLYTKRFGKVPPVVQSIEEKLGREDAKKARRKAARLKEQQNGSDDESQG